jgi:predicted Zn-dependent protease
VTRAKAIEGSNFTPIELLKTATPLIDGPKRATAIELLTEANRRDPTIRDVNLQLGYALLKDGTFVEAKAALTRAKELDSIYPETYQLLAVVNRQLGDTFGELEALARAKQFELVPALSDMQ